ncbi:BHLH domain-containing protein [Mycena sanguinolenta]|uniref:BHLH domain-containing protein n=1 Tax=Mycena sanguinolenta TaxID=230812 RepID=A0A8H6WR75_9AGAR|nr:BHLH domain-containing protein [Mycena sanguinolenta]
MASVPPALSSVSAGPPQISSIDLAQVQPNSLQGPLGLTSNQVSELVKHLPSSFLEQLSNGTLPEDAVQLLANFSQLAQGGGFRASDPSPSSHPQGPPNIQYLVHTMSPPPFNGMPTFPPAPTDDDGGYVDKPDGAEGSKGKMGGGKGRRGGALMGSDEWARQRKDSHVHSISLFPLDPLTNISCAERSRAPATRGISTKRSTSWHAPCRTAQAKSLRARSSRARCNTSTTSRRTRRATSKSGRWEKLLMDQAMGDLQVQLDEIRKMWEEERMQRQRAEKDLATLRGNLAAAAANGAEKRSNPDAEGGGDKRQKTS